MNFSIYVKCLCESSKYIQFYYSFNIKPGPIIIINTDDTKKTYQKVFSWCCCGAITVPWWAVTLVVLSALYSQSNCWLSFEIGPLMVREVCFFSRCVSEEKNWIFCYCYHVQCVRFNAYTRHLHLSFTFFSTLFL